jgi:Uma2 family endonuclease
MGKTREELFAEWLALGEGVRAEIVGERVVVQPRPMPAHANIARALGALLGVPFHDLHDHGGPGGWYLFPEVDVRFASGELVVPDLAGWRRERLAQPNMRPLEVVPDWVCEIVSPSNEAHDRVWKADLYAAHGVPFYWLVDPDARVLEAYALVASPDAPRRWLRLGAWDETASPRIAPFEAIELPVGRLFLPRGEGAPLGDRAP